MKTEFSGQFFVKFPNIKFFMKYVQRISGCSMRADGRNTELQKGRAVAQAVRRWLPTAAARVRVRARYVDKAALGQAFSEYFGFPCQSFHQFLHHQNHLRLAQ
jgi:hypothetical protein